jgi:hypothetical protein
MTKIVINKRIGAFSLSYFGITEYAKCRGLTLYFYADDANGNLHKVRDPRLLESDYYTNYCYTKDLGDIVTRDTMTYCYFSAYDIPRDDPTLIEIIEEFGSDKISSTYSLLKIIEIPDNIEWEIEESEEGIEWISEKQRIWS